MEGGVKLVLTGHGLQLFAEIEHPVGEVGDGGVHTTLLAEDADELAAPAVLLPADEALKEGVAAIREADGPQCLVADSRLHFRLLHHGRQLLIVADEDELTYLRENAHQARLQNLGSLIDDGEVELLQLEDEGARLEHRGGADDDGRLQQQLADCVEARHLTDHPIQQMVGKAGVAGTLIADADIADPGISQHSADLIDGTVGVGG